MPWPLGLLVAGLTLLTPVTVFGLLIGRMWGAVPLWVLFVVVPVLLVLCGSLLLTPLAPFVRWWFENPNEAPVGDDLIYIPETHYYRPGYLIVTTFSLYCLSVAFACGLYVLLSWAATDLPGPLKLLVLLPAGYSILQVAGMFLTGRRRERFVKAWNEFFNLGIVTGLTVAYSGLLISYSTANVALERQDLVSFSVPGQRAPGAEEFMQFYAWHFLDVIPLLDVNATLQWEVPLVYEGTAAGASVLCFKAIVVLALVKTAIDAARLSRRPSP